MRCLNTTTFQIKEADHAWFKRQGYAILSHRWSSSEILFHEIDAYGEELRRTKGRHANKALDKILGACFIARQQSFQWMWMDSCCINRRSPMDLTESINSTFRWYREASVCIAYLADIVVPPPRSTTSTLFDDRTGRPSIWFTRAWTLQELLAPTSMQFYDSNWRFMGTRGQLAKPIQQITGIKTQFLTGAEDFRSACIATKMSWMAGRQTTQVEDMAYSMLGIFNVSMKASYGDGPLAFIKLQQELIYKNDESLFAWRMPPGENIKGRSSVPSLQIGPGEWGLMAASPAWYAGCGQMSTLAGRGVIRHMGGFGLTSQGIDGPLGKPSGSGGLFRQKKASTMGFSLNCWAPDRDGKMKAVQIQLRCVSSNPPVFVRTNCQMYDLVEGHGKVNPSAAGTVMQPEVF